MEQEIRNKLRNVVTQCRKLLEESISQELEGKYAIFAKKDQVTADPSAKMTHLSEEEQAARTDILDHFAHIQARGFKPKEALDQLIREIAFTHLNRLCAYKMMEAREVYVGGQKFREAVSRGVNSNGVKFYLADHPEDERLFNTGHQDVAYRHFLDWLGGALSDEIGVLFNPNDPANRLYPRQKTLDEVLDLLNGGGIKAEETELRDQWPQIWSQDETIGWVYQYFNPKELRDRLKQLSKFPLNGYEISVRSAYFTPLHVVKYLVDNTLGCIWYEMQTGDTKLKNQCRYMVRRPTEIFLKDGEQPPKYAAEGNDGHSQDELLKLPVYIPHRPKKDPREFKILDPACGSGHFLLYCFDLLLTIYEEAYADPDLGPALKQDYPTLDTLKRDVPRLILAHNLHGIDIDLRASQIAALALWLRCQRAYQEMCLKKDRPQITRSNVVCAEPMPGEEQMLKEFVGQLEPKVLGQVVKVVFDKMKLAGEAGSLLKIEDDIRDTVAAAKRQWEAGPVSVQLSLFDKPSASPVQRRFNLSDITDSQFFEQAETRVKETLRTYSEKAQNGERLQRRLFSEDAAQGFAFVDLCHTPYDVVLMNPPYAETEGELQSYLRSAYCSSWTNLYSAFIERGMALAGSHIGLVCPEGFLSAYRLRDLRRTLVDDGQLQCLSCLGKDVFDEMGIATVALTASVKKTPNDALCVEFDERTLNGTIIIRRSVINARTKYILTPDLIKSTGGSWNEHPLSPTYATVTKGNCTFDDFRFIRTWWEVPPDLVGVRWQRWQKGGEYQPFVSSTPYVIDWSKEDDGAALREFGKQVVGTDAQVAQSSKYWWKAGLVGPAMNTTGAGFNVRVMPKGQIFSAKSTVLITTDRTKALVLLCLLNSRSLRWFLYQQGAGLSGNTGKIKQLPILWPSPDVEEQFADRAKEAIQIMSDLESCNETSPLFVSHAPEMIADLSKKYRSLVEELDDDIASLYSHEVDDDAVKPCSELAGNAVNEAVGGSDSRSVAHGRASYWMGVAFGRWNATLAGDRERPLSQSYSDLFAPLPDRPPGWHFVEDDEHDDGAGLHIKDALLVDEDGTANDVVERMRRVLDSLCHDQAETMEARTCRDLGVTNLRDHLRDGGVRGFFNTHIAKYTRSRRKAPIYWLLQSSKKNYAIWLYYHRLDKDLLFKALVNYVEPKIRLEICRLDSLRTRKIAAGTSGKEAKRLAKEAERQEDFLSELRDFEDKLRRAANLHLEPDLNDGVVLNIAPLWELVPWREAKEYWDELMEGKYEWSSIGKQLRAKGLVK
jgi:hypothetical protein